MQKPTCFHLENIYVFLHVCHANQIQLMCYSVQKQRKLPGEYFSPMENKKVPRLPN